MSKAHRFIYEGILFTDFYQLSMAQLYYRQGLHENEAQFDYFFRAYPDYGEHKAGYCIHAGLASLVDWMQDVCFGEEELRCLRDHRSRSGNRFFDDDFLRWLQNNGNFGKISLQAIPEGRVVHAQVPLVVVRGPFAMAQILESALLNHLNYQTLIATKASRIYEAGCRRLVIDFGMRRAQGKGANAGTRAALIGGAGFSSNTGMSYYLGYPPKGTHAHSMVQAFIALGKSELDAFRAYADVYPDDCLLLVDTVNTLESGIPNAIKVFTELKKKGHSPVGIRLDSGDLAYLSIQAAKMLNKAGFENTVIVLSNQLDEMVVWQIVNQIRNEAPHHGLDADSLIARLVYGVGTHLIVSGGNAALDGIYKLTAIKHSQQWLPAFKRSETASKTIVPGCKKSYRIYDKRYKAVADVLALEDEELEGREVLILHHPHEPEVVRQLRKSEISKIEPLLADIMRDGKLQGHIPTIEDMRALRRDDLERLDTGVKRFINPHCYHVSLTEKLWKLKQDLTGKFSLWAVLGLLLLFMPVLPALAQLRPQAAAETAEDMLNTYLLKGASAAVLREPVIESGLYRIDFNIGDTEQPVYLTTDGKFMIFPDNMIDIAALQESAQSKQKAVAITRRDRPSVELYVMSLCPYGVKAEQMILPVIAEFGNSLDFSIKYIVDVKGETLDEVDSLRGPQEVEENLRQVAVRRYYPDKFSAYLDMMREKSCLISCGEVSLDTYWKTAARKLKMNPRKIESFVNSDEALTFLKRNDADVKKYAINASPTLIINGMKTDAVYQGPKATRTAICSAFSVPPSECH